MLAIGMIATVSAQSTSPRWGTGPNNDNTGRALTYAYSSIVDATGADSAFVYPNAYSSTIRVTLTDSIYLNFSNIKKSFASDHVIIVASGASGTKVKFSTANVISTGTATLSAGGRAVIKFIFDGVKWVEDDRAVQ